MPTDSLARPFRFDPRTCPSCLRPKPLLALDDIRGGKSGFGSPKSAFIRAQKIERAYASRLRSIAKHVGDIIRSFDPTSQAGPSLIERALQRYANTLTPWAEAAARLMTTEVAARDERSWRKVAATMGRELKNEIANAPVGQVMQALQAEQVVLIRSLPLEAGERVQRLARESLSSGARPETLVAEIMRTQDVTAARARTIARTETSRAATVLTQARAQHIGSEGYFWTTANDSDVRASHKAMSGKFVRWDSPPTLDGLTGHAGALPNCFVGSTKVSLANGLSRIWRVPFNGEVVEIATAVASVTVTPNHPILTRRGWVPAGEIQESDYLVQAVNDACVVVDSNKNNPLPTFDEVFGAFAVDHETGPGLGFNFYGDIPYGDVDIVSVNGLLSDDRVPETFKSIRDLALTDADGGVADFIIVSGNDHVAEPLPSSLGHQGFSLLVGEAAHADEVGLTAIPSLDAVLLKAPADCEPSHSVLLRQSQLTGPSQILVNNIGLWKVCNSVVAAGVRARNCDPASPEFLAEIVGVDADSERGVFEAGSRKYQPLRVLNVGRRNFLGHVFTIQTLNGWYSVTSAGIIAKNCRCHPTPQIPDL